MGLQVSIAIVGFLALTFFIISGFWTGRQRRSVLIHDEQAEKNAKLLKPTLADIDEIQNKEQVVIVNSESISDQVFVDADSNKQIDVDNTDNTDNVVHNDEKTGNSKHNLFNDLLVKIKHLFSSTTKVESPEVTEPKQVYQINIVKDNGEKISVKEAIAFCKKYNLVLGEYNLYYLMGENNNVIFKLCGSSEPYGFSESDSETVSYEALCLFLNLPDRGYAEDYYLKMAQFAYLVAKEIGGSMLDNQKKPMGEEIIMKDREILAIYDQVVSV
ncbi:MAG: cell division protein ZipA C-terminal FtsZ-binding domain-containing protein [Succinivibrionaceae bacterium]